MWFWHLCHLVSICEVLIKLKSHGAVQYIHVAATPPSPRLVNITCIPQLQWLKEKHQTWASTLYYSMKPLTLSSKKEQLSWANHRLNDNHARLVCMTLCDAYVLVGGSVSVQCTCMILPAVSTCKYSHWKSPPVFPQVTQVVAPGHLKTYTCTRLIFAFHDVILLLLCWRW